ncbi:MAG: hypothetical protein ACI3ZG_05955 [Candidatus Coprenecus sp.]
MTRLLTTTLLFLFAFIDYADSQTLSGKISIRSRDNIIHKLPDSICYMMPQFTKADIVYTSGKQFSAVVNICNVDNSVRFINRDGDTLLMANANSVQYITTPEALYTRINDYFIRNIAMSGKISLGIRNLFRIDVEQTELSGGGIGLPKTSTARTASNLETDYNVDKDVAREVEWEIKSEFILSDSQKRYPCKRSSFEKLFPSKKKEIKEYVKQNKIDFDKKEDLILLFKFCVE